MASKAIIFHSILFVFCISIVLVHGRILSLNSSSNDDDQYLISDGVDHHDHDHDESQSTSLNAIPSTCDHMYYFLPCAENVPGYIFLIFMYQLLAKYVKEQIDRGNEELFNINAETKVGGIIFGFLRVIPSMIFMILSGVFSRKESAQSTVSLGVGIYAGITVFSLTFHWGIILMFGRRNLKVTSDNPAETSDSNCLAGKKQLIKLKDEGVKLDEETQKTAGIMLLSLVPYVIVQLVNIFHSSSANRLITFIALIVSVVSLVSYFIYQVMNTWMQERSLAYAKWDILKTRFLQHAQQDGKFYTEDGEINTDAIHQVFVRADKNNDNCIAKDEAKQLVLDLIKGGKMPVDEEFAVSGIMENFDFDKSGSINEEEFLNGCINWLSESAQHSHSTFRGLTHEVVKSFRQKKKDDDCQDINRIMTQILAQAKTEELKSKSLITPDGKPDIDGIKSLFNAFDRDGDKSISKSEVQKLISSVHFGNVKRNPEEIVNVIFEKFDTSKDGTIDESEFEATMENSVITWTQLPFDKWVLSTSLIRVILGSTILALLGGPLLVNMLQLSHAVGLTSFSTSFVVLPLTMNIGTLVAAILPAKQKNQTIASLAFSEIYGSVIMNNIIGLTALLCIVYFKGLTWDFSAEVLTILFVCAVIGLMAYKCSSYPLWTCILAFLLYPISLGLYYFAHVFWSWN